MECMTLVRTQNLFTFNWIYDMIGFRIIQISAPPITAHEHLIIKMQSCLIGDLSDYGARYSFFRILLLSSHVYVSLVLFIHALGMRAKRTEDSSGDRKTDTKERCFRPHNHGKKQSSL